MSASAEPIAWLVRVGESHQKFGDSWRFAVVCTSCGDTAWMCGGNGEMTPEIMKSIGEILRELGFKRVEWMRVKNGEFERTGRNL